MNLHPGDILCDVSELAHLPLRTGIQRVTRELIRHWAGPGRLLLCIYDREADGLRFLPEFAAAMFTAPPVGAELTVGEERDALHAAIAAETVRAVPPDAGPILNVELFVDLHRTRFYERLAREGRDDLFWLLYDFIPWIQPHWFGQFAWRAGMHFLHAAIRMPHVAFISEATRQDFRRRIMRDRAADGPVIVLGGDGLALEPQRFRAGRDRYVTLGSLEPRKRTAAVIEGFTQLWDAGSDARLTVIGRMVPEPTREAKLMEGLAAEDRFTFLPNASDEAVRDQLRHARALLFPSASEGFGLPPFEALHCGIPVVAGRGVPSLDMLPPGGRIELEEVTPEAIADAVRQLEDDGTAARLSDEAAALHVPTWRDFAAAVAAWVREG